MATRAAPVSRNDISQETLRDLTLRDFTAVRVLMFHMYLKQARTNCDHPHRVAHLSPALARSARVFHRASAAIAGLRFSGKGLVSANAGFRTGLCVSGSFAYAALDAAAERLAPQMNAQHMANIIWAFAKLGVPPTPATGTALDAVAPRRRAPPR